MLKKVSLILVLVLMITACGTLTACNKDSGKIQVKIGMWPDATSPQDVAMFEKWEAAFEADHPEYDIIAAPYTYSPNTVNAMGTSGQLPTVFQTYNTEPQKLIDAGFIADITDELKELGWYDKMDEDMRNAVSKNGKVYGVPRDGYGMGLFLNLAIFYDVGIIDKDASGNYILHDEDGKPLYPTTFDEIEEASRLITPTYGKGSGIVILSADKQGGWQFSNMAWNFGTAALQVENNGKYTANLNDEGAVKALEWIKKMRAEDIAYPEAGLKYVDWYEKIGSGSVAMAFCGSDSLALPVTNYGFDKENMAFVPMPTGDGESFYSLYGGVPYVFAANAKKEQIMGALMFLKYMGRSPETDEIAVNALETGHQTALAKGMPILPTIRPWINEDYLAITEELDRRYIKSSGVNMYYFEDFFNTVQQRKRVEEPHYCQDMYGLFDGVLQEVMSSNFAKADCRALLNTANTNFQNNYLSKLK